MNKFVNLMFTAALTTDKATIVKLAATIEMHTHVDGKIARNGWQQK